MTRIFNLQCFSMGQLSGCVKRLSAALLLLVFAVPALAQTISGTVYQDFNASGTQDALEPGVGGVTINAFDAAGANVGSGTSIASGGYSLALSVGAGTDIRIEFTNVPDFLQSGSFGTESGTTVRFAQSGDSGLDLGLADPGDFCDADPFVFTSCYVAGDPLSGAAVYSTMEGLVAFPYSATGSTKAGLVTIATPDQIGSTWGMAYQRTSSHIFTSAVLKRHFGFGSIDGTNPAVGGIYAIDVSNVNSPVVSNWIDVNSIGIDTGLTPRDGTPANSLGATPTTPSFDTAAYELIGKLSIGDIDMDNEGTLWLTNLNDRSLYGIRNADPAVTPVSGDVIGPIALPDIGLPVASDLRPWAIEIQNGMVYVGAVYTAETSQDVNELRGYVFEFNPVTNSINLIFDFPFNYERGLAGVAFEDIGDWRPWNGVADYPSGDRDNMQPIVSDLEFDTDGSLTIGVIDRWGLQTQDENFEPDPTATNMTTVTLFIGVGDVLRACNVSGSLVFEGGVGCPFPALNTNDTDTGGNDGDEYYQGDFGEDDMFLHETAMGALLYLPGRSDVMITQWDPFLAFNQGGVRTLDNTDGDLVTRFLIYDADDVGTGAKGVGLGDIVAQCPEAPLEIGNRLWCDDGANAGVQDPGELGIGNVPVTMICDTDGNGTVGGGTDESAMVMTDNATVVGQYLFTDSIWMAQNGGSLIPRQTTCQVRVDLSDTTLDTACGVVPATPNAGANDLHDSDGDNGVLAAGFSAVEFDTGTAGQNDHSYDFGFGPVMDFDRGDAPDSFATLDASNGAVHAVMDGFFLGACVDSEDDGQPGAGADGDDLNTGNNTFGSCAANDDEDGVLLPATIAACSMTSIDVTASQAGLLDAFIDFNGNDNFADAGDQIFTSQAVAAGVNSLTFAVPCDAVAGTSYARFRFSTAGGLSFNGVADDGEVEDYLVTITQLDLGDAPDSYATLMASNGPSHVLTSDLFLGACVDSENDGQPAATFGDPADGDDTNTGNATIGTCVGNDDEDGVSFDSMIVACGVANTTVTAAQAGRLDAWMDFNADGDFDGSEQIFVNQALAAGANGLSFNVPCDAQTSAISYARFRLSSAGGLSFDGQAMDGEVEDYAVTIKGIDLGDAPDSFATTLAANGAQHAVDPGNPLYLGACVDTEMDGAPAVTGAPAIGDDLNTGLSVLGSCAGSDDEDGVVFENMIVACETADITVTASQGGVLDAWLDLDGNGSFADTNNQIFVAQPLAAGANSLSFNVPCDTPSQANAYARFRVSSAGGLAFNGAAMDGEVEDYSVATKGLDLGDAPASFGTLLAADGARHVLDPTTASPVLGACVDSEADGQPVASGSPANGDDNGAGISDLGGCTSADDEDGVVFDSMLIACNALDLTVTASTGGLLNAWIDFNGDGRFADASDQIITDQAVASGATPIQIIAPCDLVPGNTYARFRISSAGGLGPIGLAMDGEVEDYEIMAKGLDFSDAPDPTFPTLLASDGARHVVQPTGNPVLGVAIDTEADGLPSADHSGDDNDGVDDEDGIVFQGELIQGLSSPIDITASNANGVLNAWIDFNNDGAWDASEQIATDLALTAGTTLTLDIDVPGDSVPALSCARFRYSTTAGLLPSGQAMDGEVEDYQVDIVAEDPVIGIAKQLINVGPVGGADFLAEFAVVVTNFGNTPLDGVQVISNLANDFAAAQAFEVVSLSSTDFAVNPGFNGDTDSNLLDGSDTLNVDETGMINLEIRVTPGANPGPYECSAIAVGLSPAGTGVDDASQDGNDADPDGSGPGNNNDPTIVFFEVMGVPTLSQWGLILLAMLLILFASRPARQRMQAKLNN